MRGGGAVLRDAAEGARGGAGRSRAASNAVSQVDCGRAGRGARCGSLPRGAHPCDISGSGGGIAAFVSATIR